MRRDEQVDENPESDRVQELRGQVVLSSEMNTTFVQRGLVVSCFFGSGKTTLAQQEAERPTSKVPVTDLDFATYFTTDQCQANPRFAEDYVADIMEKAKEPGAILVSSHQKVREMLVQHGVKFTFVYPEITSQSDLAERMAHRAGGSCFEAFPTEWIAHTHTWEMQKGCKHVVLSRGTYLVQDDLLYCISGGSPYV